MSELELQMFKESIIPEDHEIQLVSYSEKKKCWDENKDNYMQVLWFPVHQDARQKVQGSKIRLVIFLPQIGSCQLKFHWKKPTGTFRVEAKFVNRFSRRFKHTSLPKMKKSHRKQWF